MDNNDVYKVLLDIFIEVLLTFLGVVLALWYENQGAPRLEFLPHDPTDDNKAYGRCKFFHVNVRNAPKKKRWVPRQTAQACHGDVTFFTADHKQLGRPMPIRWNGMPEPIQWQILYGEVKELLDQRLMRISRYIDIPPDKIESFGFV